MAPGGLQQVSGSLFEMTAMEIVHQLLGCVEVMTTAHVLQTPVGIIRIIAEHDNHSIRELEEYWEEEDVREQETEERLIAFVRKMKKSEAQKALLQLLLDGPDWQYDRFVEDYLGEW